MISVILPTDHITDMPGSPGTPPVSPARGSMYSENSGDTGNPCHTACSQTSDPQAILCSLISLMSQPAQATSPGGTPSSAAADAGFFSKQRSVVLSLPDRQWLILQKLQQLGTRGSGHLLRAHCRQLAQQWTAEITSRQARQLARQQSWHYRLLKWLRRATPSQGQSRNPKKILPV